MTTRGHRRTAPALIGLGTGALVAVLVAVVGPMRPEVPGPTPVTVVGNTAAPARPAPAVVGASTAVLLLALPGLPPYLPAVFAKVPGPAKPTLPRTPTQAPAKPVAPKKPVAPGLSGPAAAVVALTNAERARAGCKPLQVDPRLNKSARGHSSDMSRRGYFEHESPEGENFADREAEAGFEGNSGGENIARGQRSAAEVMDDWMHSPGHKRNILDCKFTKIGVGYEPDGHYWTQNFGG